MSTFESLVADLSRDVQRVQPRDALQFCASWFQSRLEEQRTRMRDALAQRSHSLGRDLPSDLFVDTPLGSSAHNPPSISPHTTTIPSQRSTLRQSVAQTPSPFGTLNVPGNALLPDPPVFRVDGREIPSPLSTHHPSPFYDSSTPTASNPGDYLAPPTSAIFARRTSVSAESIAVDSTSNFVPPVYPKSEDQLTRIKASVEKEFIFRNLDEEQRTSVINAMQEKKVPKDELVIRQGDEGEDFYIVESGTLHCYIRELPTGWNEPGFIVKEEHKLPKPNHPIYGKDVAQCKQGDSFGELALMYGHKRAASVLATESSTLWALDRMTFRTIVLNKSHKRRTMYENFLTTVPLLSSLNTYERSKIADALVSRTYDDDEVVVREGDKGDTFFFIEEGEATVTKRQRGPNGELTVTPVGTLRKGEYFGGKKTSVAS
jgi:cAMP-dependent protein kinase regulator